MDPVGLEKSGNSGIDSILYRVIATLETEKERIKTLPPGHPDRLTPIETAVKQIEHDITEPQRPSELNTLLEKMKRVRAMATGPGIDPYAGFIQELRAIAKTYEGGKRRRTRRRKGSKTRRRGGERRYRGDLPRPVKYYDDQANARDIEGEPFWNIRDIKNIATGKTNIRNENAPRPGSTLAAVKDRPAQEARQKLVELVVKKHPPKVGETVEIETLPQFLADELRRARKSGTQTYFSEEYFNGLEPADKVNGQLDVLVERSFSLSYDEPRDVASTLKTDKKVNLTDTQVDRLIPLLERLSNTKDFIHLGRVAPLAPGNTNTWEENPALAQGKPAKKEPYAEDIRPAALASLEGYKKLGGKTRRRRPMRSTRRR